MARVSFRSEAIVFDGRAEVPVLRKLIEKYGDTSLPVRREVIRLDENGLIVKIVPETQIDNGGELRLEYDKWGYAVRMKDTELVEKLRKIVSKLTTSRVVSIVLNPEFRENEILLRAEPLRDCMRVTGRETHYVEIVNKINEKGIKLGTKTRKILFGKRWHRPGRVNVDVRVTDRKVVVKIIRDEQGEYKINELGLITAKTIAKTLNPISGSAFAERIIAEDGLIIAEFDREEFDIDATRVIIEEKLENYLKMKGVTLTKRQKKYVVDFIRQLFNSLELARLEEKEKMLRIEGNKLIVSESIFEKLYELAPYWAKENGKIKVDIFEGEYRGKRILYLSFCRTCNIKIEKGVPIMLNENYGERIVKHYEMNSLGLTIHLDK